MSDTTTPRKPTPAEYEIAKKGLLNKGIYRNLNGCVWIQVLSSHTPLPHDNNIVKTALELIKQHVPAFEARADKGSMLVFTADRCSGPVLTHDELDTLTNALKAEKEQGRGGRG